MHVYVSAENFSMYLKRISWKKLLININIYHFFHPIVNIMAADDLEAQEAN